MYKKAEPLYGAPRGNRVMKQKRVGGLTARKQLKIHVAGEKCSIAGCLNPACVTRNSTGVLYTRFCLEHVETPRKRTNFDPRELLKLPWE